MKFVYTTDWHGRSNNPISRKDDYPETVLKKVQWVVDFANEHNAINLIGGDMLNRPDTSPNFISKLAKVLSGINPKNRNYAILGNHDIFGGNDETFNRAPLHILEGLEVINILTPEPLLVSQGGVNVSISGSNYSYDVDDSDKRHYSPVGEKGDNDFWIHLTHGFLGNFNIPGMKFTKFEEIENTKADIILAGHDHKGFGIRKENGYTAINPGSLLRVSCSTGDMGLTPSVVLIEVFADKTFKAELIPLPPEVCRPSDEVLDRDALVSEKAALQNLMSFSETIKMDISSSEDIGEALSEFLSNEEISDDVKKIVLNNFSKAEEERGRKNV